MWLASRHRPEPAVVVDGELNAELLAALPCALVRRLPEVAPGALFAAYHLARHGAGPQRLRHALGLSTAQALVVINEVRGAERAGVDAVGCQRPRSE